MIQSRIQSVIRQNMNIVHMTGHAIQKIHVTLQNMSIAHMVVNAIHREPVILRNISMVLNV